VKNAGCEVHHIKNISENELFRYFLTIEVKNFMFLNKDKLGLYHV